MGLEIVPTLIEKLGSGKQSIEVNSRLESIINGAIDPLISQLGQKDPSDRDQAAKKLTGMGSSIVPHLQEAIKAGKLNYDTAVRANDVIRTLGGEPIPVRPPEIYARRGARAL